MIPSALLAVLALLSAPSAPAAPPVPQEETPAVDERPEVKTMLAELGEHIKAKGEQDEKAIEVIDKLVLEFPSSGPKDRAAIVKAISDCFDVKRTKEVEEGVPDDKLYRASAVALGWMAPESVKVIIPLIGDKSHRKNSSLQQSLVLSLGKTKSPEGVKVLLALLKHKDAPMQAVAADALANYSDADQETRKLIFEDLVRTLTDQMVKKDQNVSDLEAQERWNTISGPIVATLQKISGHGETDPNRWLSWWNDNKKKDWGAKAE